jgi:hypothetical protein
MTGEVLPCTQTAVIQSKLYVKRNTYKMTPLQMAVQGFSRALPVLIEHALLGWRSMPQA